MDAVRRWALVLVGTLGLVAVPVVRNAWPVRAAAPDPARIAASAARPYHGYVQSTGLLGLPALPRLQQVTALLSGTTEMRAWFAAPDRWRVDVLGPGTETDFYRTPDAEFTWDYGDNQLTRITGEPPVRLPRAADLTPPELVRRILSSAGGDRVEPLPAKRVAGIAAGGLRLIPSDPDTTVAHVDVWADPGGLPLQAEITAKGGARPVFVTRFLEVHAEAPDEGVLTPPAPRPGIGYTETEAPDLFRTINRWQPAALPDTLGGRTLSHATSVAGLYGRGLTGFVVIALPDRLGAAAYRQISAYGQQLPGGSAATITTGLLNLLAVRADDHTFLVAGLVSPALLRQVATEVRR
ncbi:hypothetical protein GCM10023107_68360 [Actinoplanes octamycinicus]